MFRYALVVLLFISFSIPCNAQIVFGFGNEGTAIGGGLDGEESGSFTIDGLTITVTSFSGEFKADGTSFGIDGFTPDNDAVGFDVRPEAGGPGGAGPEQFTFSFDKAVTITGFSVSSFEADDQINLLDFTAENPLVASLESNGATEIDFLMNVDLGARNEIDVVTTAGTFGNGWSLDSITVSPSLSAVPEPGSIVVLCVLGGGFLARRRYLIKKNSVKESPT